MAQQLVVCNLKLKGARIPLIVQVKIVRMDKSNFFVCVKQE